MVPTRRQSAHRARVPAILQSLRYTRSACAGLRRAFGVDLHQFTPSVRSFVREVVQELRPACIVNGLRQHSRGETLHVQIFDGDHAVLVHQSARQLVLKVGALVAHVNMRALEQPHGLTSPGAAFLPPRHLALTAPQVGFGVPVVPGILDLRAIREHRKTVQPDIDSDFVCAHWKRRDIALHAEAHEPAARFPLDGRCLDPTFDRPVQFDLDVTRTMQTDAPVIEETASAWMLRERDAVIATGGTVARESRLFFSTFHPAKESLEPLIDTAQDILCALRIHQRQTPVRTHGRQLLVLVVVADRFAANLPCAYALLKSGIVKGAGFPQLAVQKFHLWLRGIQTILEGQAHLLTSVCWEPNVY